MADFRPTCRQCFHECGQTILLKQKEDGKFFCPKNAAHKPTFDIKIV